MLILGIETALDICGVAFANENGIIIEKNVDGKNAHSSQIFRLVDELLKTGNLHLDQIGGVAVSIGPGSFTGLRIGLSAAKGVSFGLSVPIIGIPTLDSLAVQYQNIGETVWTLLPFRRDELYACKFKITKNHAEKVTDYFILTIDEFLNNVNVFQKVKIIGRIKEDYVDQFNDHPSIEIVPFDIINLRSGIIAEMGVSRLNKGIVDDLYSLEPLYLRDFPLK